MKIVACTIVLLFLIEVNTEISYIYDAMTIFIPENSFNKVMVSYKKTRICFIIITLKIEFLLFFWT